MGSDDAQFALSETWMQMACLISRKASIMDGVKLEYHVWVSVPGLFPTVNQGLGGFQECKNFGCVAYGACAGGLQALAKAHQ